MMYHLRHTRLLRHTTGQRLQPSVQQQQRQPQNNHFTLTGSVFLRTELTLEIVSWYSSGASFPVKAEGKSVSNLFDNPNLKKK